eukprot:GILI01029535.1.p2 GENE.GILI01029535.1~~GILI01029535.1.p2  ORF type:complete len:118 (-),score=8.92 GILI01029535.1:136-489(-)
MKVIVRMLCSFSDVPAQVHVPKKHILRQPPPPHAQKPTVVSGGSGFVPLKQANQRPPSSRKGSSPIRTDGKGASPIIKATSPLRQTKPALPPMAPRAKSKNQFLSLFHLSEKGVSLV